MDDNPSTVTSTSEDGIPLHRLVRRGASSSPTTGLGSMNRKNSRNHLLSAGNSRIRKTPSRSKLKDSDEEASQSLLGATGLTDGRAALIGDGEQDGEFDSLWKDQNDEEQSLLEEGRMLVCLRRPQAYSLCIITDAQMQDGSAPLKSSKSSIASTSSGKAAHSKLGQPRTIPFGAPGEGFPNDFPYKPVLKTASGATDKLKSRFPANIVRNQKYNVATFLPIVLYEQFKFFFNLYFLLVALSQFVPALRIGFLATYIAPLAFVLAITIGKEAYDDYQRYLRDVAANSTRYKILDRTGLALHGTTTDAAPLTTLPSTSIASSKLRVGDLVLITKNQRVPADCVLLRTSDASGSCFVRTDQLDGETDWKLRVAVERSQGLPDEKMLLDLDAEVYGQ